MSRDEKWNIQRCDSVIESILRDGGVVERGDGRRLMIWGTKYLLQESYKSCTEYEDLETALDHFLEDF